MLQGKGFFLNIQDTVIWFPFSKYSEITIRWQIQNLLITIWIDCILGTLIRVQFNKIVVKIPKGSNHCEQKSPAARIPIDILIKLAHSLYSYDKTFWHDLWKHTKNHEDDDAFAKYSNTVMTRKGPFRNVIESKKSRMYFQVFAFHS